MRNADGESASNMDPQLRIARFGVYLLEKGISTMKSILTCLVVSAASVVLSTGTIAAPQANSPRASTGPNQTMNSSSPTTKTQNAQSNTPGNAASAPGSAFNPDGTAGTKYAGQQPQNSRNTASVSQYDVACAKQK
jgi:hypothetical protein